MLFGSRNKTSGQPDNAPGIQPNPDPGVPAGGPYYQGGNTGDPTRQASAGMLYGQGNYAGGYAPNAAYGGYAANPQANPANTRGQAGGYAQPGGVSQGTGQPGYAGNGARGYGGISYAQGQNAYPDPGNVNRSYTGQGMPNAGYGAPAQPMPGYGTQGQPSRGYGTQHQPVQGYGARNQSAPGYGTQNYPGMGYGAQSYPNQGTGARMAPNPGAGNTAYSNPGYGTQGMPGPAYNQSYVNPGNTASAYGGYPQMGAQPPKGQTGVTGQIPLNGGGYVPPPVPVRKQPFVFNDWKLYLLGAALVGILAAGLILNQPVVLGVFLALTLASVILFWAVPLIDTGKRLSFTLIFAVLSVAAVFGLVRFMAVGGNNNAGTDPEGSAVTSPSRWTGSQAIREEQSGVTVVDHLTGEVLSTVVSSAVTDTPAPAQPDTAATDRAVEFFQYWYGNMNDQMLELCSPTWKNSVDNPKASLFGLLANRKPLDYSVENVSGTPDDTSRTVTVVSTIDRGNGKDPSKYRLSVLMVREGENWYVDPQSLKTYEKTETPDPNVTNTPAPTEAPQYTNATVLYYNPEGGTKYHLDQNCKSTHEKWLPLKGHFTFGEINDEAYAKLERCNVCGAPLRPTN